VGTTTQGESGRYYANYYKKMKVRYRVEFRGLLQEALEAEKMRISAYPLTTPENLNRPDQAEGGIHRYRLSRPPMNTADH